MTERLIDIERILDIERIVLPYRTIVFLLRIRYLITMNTVQTTAATVPMEALVPKSLAFTQNFSKLANSSGVNPGAFNVADLVVVLHNYILTT